MTWDVQSHKKQMSKSLVSSSSVGRQANEGRDGKEEGEEEEEEGGGGWRVA